MIFRRFLFHNFHLVYRTDQWLRRRFTHAGMLMLGALVLSGVFGINTRATNSYQLLMLVVAVLLVSALSALFFRARLKLTRRLPRFATADQALSYTVWIKNEGKRAQRGLIGREILAAEPPSVADFAYRKEPADSRRNWFDRHVGYPRWANFMRWRRGASAEELTLPDLPPGEWVEVRMCLVPHRRGFIRLRAVSIAKSDPLGVFKALARAGRPESLLVLPRRYEVSWAELLGRAQDRVGGQSKAASTGGSEEFASLREYRPGDPMRHIHWKGWARLGEPVVREFHEECFVRQGLILDTFLPRESSDACFEEAVSVAASFAYAVPTGAGTLELMFVGAEVYQVESSQGHGAADRLLEALACVQATPDHPFGRLQKAVLARASELSACVCVLLAWDDARQELVARLRNLGVPLLVLVLVDGDGDLDPGPMSDCPTRFKRLRVERVEEDLLLAETSTTPPPTSKDAA
ncbi:MAG TPA: DUF58 domain-containing protein [Gammaproteobacteria bacterium]|nr:DUF58 domain-containing protein [Gammaproteobacteria bacterium]